MEKGTYDVKKPRWRSCRTSLSQSDASETHENLYLFGVQETTPQSL